MTTILDGFLDYAPLLTIPSRDLGMVKFAPMLPSQAYMHSEIVAGLEAGCHDFTILKGGRQSAVGGSTYMDGVSLYMMQKYSGMVGMMVSDDDGNRDYRRDVMLTMLDSLPRSHRQRVRRDNARMLAWENNPRTGYMGSRLLFAAAGKREDKNVGRSKGLNFNYNDEFGFWFQQKMYSALRASRSEVHPMRLYVDISTANGIGSLMHEEWKIAERSVTRRAIFVSCWRNQGTTCRIEEGDPRWERYGTPAPTRQELDWMREVQRRYGVMLCQEFWAWYRWKCAEELAGDETLMSQEYAILPEEAFQAFGDKFIDAHVVQSMRRQAEPKRPTGYEYEWSKFIEHTEVRECDPADAQLTVWEEPEPDGVYIIAAHAWGSSSPRAKENVCQVYRAWPDALRLVAEFAGGTEVKTYQLAWVCLHMCGAYHTRAPIWRPPYFIFDVSMGGQHLLSEIKLIEELGFGTSPLAISERSRLVNMMGAIHYLYRRLDSFTSSVVRDIKIGGSSETRARVLYALRDHAERDHLEIFSTTTIDQLAMLRQGEDDDADSIAGGGETEESRALTLCMAIEAWRTTAMGDLMMLLAPRKPEQADTRRVEHILVAGFLPGARGGEE